MGGVICPRFSSYGGSGSFSGEANSKLRACPGVIKTWSLEPLPSCKSLRNGGCQKLVCWRKSLRELDCVTEPSKRRTSDEQAHYLHSLIRRSLATHTGMCRAGVVRLPVCYWRCAALSLAACRLLHTLLCCYWIGSICRRYSPKRGEMNLPAFCLDSGGKRLRTFIGFQFRGIFRALSWKTCCTLRHFNKPSPVPPLRSKTFRVTVLLFFSPHSSPVA